MYGKVSLNNIKYYMQQYYEEAFINIETSEIVEGRDIEKESLELISKDPLYIKIPFLDESQRNQFHMAFLTEYVQRYFSKDPKTKKYLTILFELKDGPAFESNYHHFLDDELNMYDARKQFENKKLHEYAIAWCEKNGIPWTD